MGSLTELCDIRRQFLTVQVTFLDFTEELLKDKVMQTLGHLAFCLQPPAKCLTHPCPSNMFLIHTDKTENCRNKSSMYICPSRVVRHRAERTQTITGSADTVKHGRSCAGKKIIKKKTHNAFRLKCIGLHTGPLEEQRWDPASSDAGGRRYERVRACNHHLIPSHAISLAKLLLSVCVGGEQGH